MVELVFPKTWGPLFSCVLTVYLQITCILYVNGCKLISEHMFYDIINGNKRTRRLLP